MREKYADVKRVIVSAAVFVLLAAVTAVLAGFAAEPSFATSSWPSFRGNDESNALVSYELPTEQALTEPAWVKSFDESTDGMSRWNLAPNIPLVINGDVVTTTGKTIIKIDAGTGKTIQSAPIEAVANWGYTPMTYEESTNTIYCPLSTGIIEAIDADTLEHKWSFSAITVLFSAGGSGSYDYVNNGLIATENLSLKFYPEIEQYECSGVSLNDAIIAAHLDKYGESGLRSELELSYDAEKKAVVATKMFGKAVSPAYYCNNIKTSKGSNAYAVKEGESIFVQLDSSEDAAYSSFDFDKPDPDDKLGEIFPLQTGTKRGITFKHGGSVVTPGSFDVIVYDGNNQQVTGQHSITIQDNKAYISFNSPGTYYVAPGSEVTVKGKKNKSISAFVKVVVDDERTRETVIKTSNLAPRKNVAFQSLCPILYHDGIVYTGFWNAYNCANYFTAVAAEKITLPDPSTGVDREYEPGDLIWRYTSAGGFYWNGAQIVGKAVIVGTQDGIDNNDPTGTGGGQSADSHLLSLDLKTGEVISDRLLKGASDICSSIVWDKEGTGRYFFTSCSGMIHSAAIDQVTGEITDVRTGNLDADQSLTVNTPVVYKGRVYIGYKPKKGAYGYFAAYKADDLTNIFRAELRGYPKGSAVITNAYETEVEGRPETGWLYAYVPYYEEPGGLQVVKFKPDADGSDPSQIVVSDLFDANGYEQYAACGMVADDRGQLYYKNDSNALFAIGKGERIVLGKATGLKLTPSGTKITVSVNSMNGATGYRVLYQLNGKGSFKKAEFKKNKGTITVPNSSYVTVKVRAEHIDAAKIAYGAYSDTAMTYAAKSTIKALTGGKKSFTVKFDKHAKANGYQIQYSLKKSMSSPKTLKKTGATRIRYTIKKLKRKKIYYVRVRSYRKVNGKTINGKWSLVKKIKTK